MIRNKTRKTIVSKKSKHCNSIWSQAIGLMFAKKPQTLIFTFNLETYHPLHMAFVRFPIDVLFLNKKKKVVEIKEAFQPWGYFSPQKKATYVIELPEKTVQKSKTKLHDQLDF